MAPYHVVLVHFPIAFLTTATLFILLRVFSDGPLARATDRTLVPLILLGVGIGLVAFAVGLSIWPLETVSSSPLARNHILMATWTLAYWTVVAITRWRVGPTIWDGAGRWVMLLLALFGAAALTVTGTLGGHLAGTATAIAQIVRATGWEIYTTYYLPDATLAIVAGAVVLLLAVGWMGRRASP